MLLTLIHCLFWIFPASIYLGPTVHYFKSKNCNMYWKNVPKLSKYRVSYYSNVIFKLFGGYLSFSKNRRVSRKWFQFVQVIQHITSLPPKMNVRKVKLLHFIPPGNRLSKNIINFFFLGNKKPHNTQRRQFRKIVWCWSVWNFGPKYWE